MPIQLGSSKEMEEQARKLSDAELAEIAWRNDQPPALKARAEIARRVGARDSKMLFWARVAAGAGIAAVVITLLIYFLQ